MADLLEGAYKASLKAKIHRKIKFGTLAFGVAFLLACFFISNNISHAIPVSYLENIDQSSVLSIMIVCLLIFYLLLFVRFRGKEFTFERSLTMKLYGRKNIIRAMPGKCSTFTLKPVIFRETLSKRSINNPSKTRDPINNPSNKNYTESKIDLAGIVHEINNPMTFVNTSVYTLRQDLKKLKTLLFDLAGNEIDSDIRAAFKERFDTLFKHLDTLNEGTTRIQEIVRNLKSFSQMNNMEMKQVNVQEGIESTLNLVKSNYKNHIDFITEFKPGLEIKGNEGELKQVFMNIMVNACQAIHEKQKRTGKKIKGTLTIKTWKENDHAAISFHDTGIGMSKEVQQKIFEPFFTTKPQGQGTGLGLSISDTIIKKHGGWIVPVSGPGKGTIITIYLPLMKEVSSAINIKNKTLH